MIRRSISLLIWSFAWLIAAGCTAWAFGALLYDFPVGKTVAGWLFAAAVAAIIIFLRGSGKKLGGVFAAFVLVLGWWFTLKPGNDRNWQPDVSKTAWAEINGDEVTLYNVRNCDYRTETDYTPHWETRTVRLSQLTGVDLAINYWGSPWMAHPIFSFQFADAPPVCFSIETRKEMGESYSAIGGIYRQYELIYVVADERDVLRVRTNFRQGEDVYLYHTTLSPVVARERFLNYLKALNALHTQPRWYNAITTNCTTAIRGQNSATERMPWDWRILVNGKADEMMYERKLVATKDLSFVELKERSRINDRAQAADADPAFSTKIRAGTSLPAPIPSK